MSRRSVALLLTFGLLLASLGAAAVATVPYVRFTPGPTVDVLGELGEGEPIVTVEGAETFPTDGQLRMTTVSTSRPGQDVALVDALMAWADPDRALYPYDAIYPEGRTAEEEQAESQVEMVSSQDTAIAAALRELGYDFEQRAVVLQVSQDGAAAGNLRARDVFVSVNDRPITRTAQVARIVGALEPGSDVTVDVLRGGEPLSYELRTRPAPDDPDRSLIGILVGAGYDFPIDVSVAIPDQIGGPSAGLVFALAIYDTLTPGELLGGLAVAGTGTIDEEGAVGAIGGVEQKIAGSEDDGADVFLVPADNCDVAVTVDTDLKLIRADTLSSVIEALQAYAADPEADVPTCDTVLEASP